MNSEKLYCPGCDQVIDQSKSACSACGLEFQLAGHLIEQALMHGDRDTEIALPLVSPRIGEYLVEMNLLTLQQLNETLQEQRDQMAEGRRQQLGHIMVEKGFITAQTVDYYVALHALHLKLQLIVGLMNHSITTNNRQNIPEPIRELKQTLLQFAAGTAASASS